MILSTLFCFSFFLGLGMPLAEAFLFFVFNMWLSPVVKFLLHRYLIHYNSIVSQKNTTALLQFWFWGGWFAIIISDGKY